MTRLFRCAPEHIRKLSTDEARGVSHADVGSFQLPSRSGTGVFQFRELSQQAPPPNSNEHIPETRTPEPDTVIEQSTNVPGGTEMHHGQTPSVGQPDAEPQCPGGESSLPSTPHEPIHDPAVETPVPVETDDDLVAITHNRDYWEIKGSTLVRHHVIPRLRMFFPHDAWECPIAIDQLQDERITHGAFVSGSDFSRTEPWRANVAAHLSQPEPWKGTTCFQIKPRAALTDEHTTAHVTEKAAKDFEAEIYMTLDDFKNA